MEHTVMLPPGEELSKNVAESSVELEETLIKIGDPLPPLRIGDVLCCQIRRRHDIFIVRQVEPEIILGSVSRARRINPQGELDGARPLVLLRAPHLDTYTPVQEGGIYQLLTGQEVQVVSRRWVEAGNTMTPVMVGAIPRVIPRYLPPVAPMVGPETVDTVQPIEAAARAR